MKEMVNFSKSTVLVSNQEILQMPPSSSDGSFISSSSSDYGESSNLSGSNDEPYFRVSLCACQVKFMWSFKS